MRKIKHFFAVTLLLVTVSFVNAQSDKAQRSIGLKTQSIKVAGLCSMDKRRIESAANSIAGIQSAVWDENTQVLVLTYSIFNKDASDKVQKKIAAVGNDTEKYRADNTAYQKLPECCHYQRKQS